MTIEGFRLYLFDAQQLAQRNRPLPGAGRHRRQREQYNRAAARSARAACPDSVTPDSSNNGGQLIRPARRSCEGLI